jgi:hypothetical protein
MTTERHIDDEFTQYIESPQLRITQWNTQSLLDFWVSSPYPGLRDWALDVLSIPAMSSEIERTFSSTRSLLTTDRNRLTEGPLEKAQCMKHWLDQGLVGDMDN